MAGQQDNLYLMFRIGQMHTLIKQMHGKICANQPQSSIEVRQSKNLLTKDMLIEFGRMVVRGIMPILTPYILAFLTGLGAMIVTVWKAFTRGWFGF